MGRPFAQQYFSYPERIKEAFIATKGLNFRDGSHVTAEEIWNFLTVEGPRRFPHSYSLERSYQGADSRDSDFFAGLKNTYLTMTLRDRLVKAHANGTPIVHVQGGQTVDPYYAAGAIPIVPGPLRGWARNMEDGLSLRDAERKTNNILEAGRQAISIECCNNPISSVEAIRQKVVPVDLIAPYTCLRCTDIAYIIEAYRTTIKDIPLHLVDFPITTDGEHTIEYIAQMLRRLVKKIGDIRGVEVSDEDVRKEIILENRGRKFARLAVEAAWSAEIPPLKSSNISGIITGGRFSNGDSLAGTEILEGAYHEVVERVKNGVRGTGLAENPVRVFSVGSCFGLRADFIETKGGLVVGTDDHLNKIFADAREDGDPYIALAEAIRGYNYEKPTEERAQYVVDMVRKSRAEGVICGYNWGCNYQSAASRMIADIVKKETGVPTINIEVADLGRAEANEQTQNRIESFIEMLR